MNKLWLLSILSVTISAQLVDYEWLSGSKVHAQNLTHMQRLVRDRDCPNCDLSGANLEELDLSGANLQGANLSGATLQRVQLVRANLEEADLSGARLLGVDLTGANLRYANLSNTRSFFFCDESPKNIQWKQQCEYEILLSRLGLLPICQGQYGAEIKGVLFCEERYFEAGIEIFERFRAFPSDAYVDEFEVLLFDSVHYVSMQGADLRGADLTNAQLRGVNLRYANLSNAQAEGADFDYALMLDTDLSGLRGNDLAGYWTTVESVESWLEAYAVTDIRESYRGIDEDE